MYEKRDRRQGADKKQGFAVFQIPYIFPASRNRIMSVYVPLRTVVPRLLRAKVDRHN